jgi:putative addiction module component (TIGR02574 family)
MAIESRTNAEDFLMTEAAKNLSIQARKLTPAERLELVDDLLTSLDEADPDIEALWAKEAADRLAAYRRGEITAVSLQDVLAKYRVT